MAAALRRLVPPTISWGDSLPARRQPLPSFASAGTGKAAAQGHRQAAVRCMIRSYGTEDAARQERKLILKQARFNLAGALVLWSIYGASLAYAYYGSSVQYEHDFPEDDE